MTCSRQYQFVIILVFPSLSIISWLGDCTSPSVLSQCLIQHSCLLLLLFSFKFLLRAGLRAVQVVFDHRSSYMLDSLFSLSMVGMVTELASCVQFQGRVTIYFFPLPLFLRPQAEPTYVSRVFQFVRLKPKESIKERQNIEVKRTKTKSLVAQTSVTKKKKKPCPFKTIYFFRCRSSYVLRRSLPMFPVFSNLSDLS